jgi:hypothetical protein
MTVSGFFLDKTGEDLLLKQGEREGIAKKLAEDDAEGAIESFCLGTIGRKALQVGRAGPAGNGLPPFLNRFLQEGFIEDRDIQPVGLAHDSYYLVQRRALLIEFAALIGRQSHFLSDPDDLAVYAPCQMLGRASQFPVLSLCAEYMFFHMGDKLLFHSNHGFSDNSIREKLVRFSVTELQQ